MNLTRKVIPILLAVAMATVMTLAGVTPASAQPPEVWVDDNYCPACPNDGHTWGYDAFAGIQDGIDAVASPGTVHVAAGTYYENIILKDGVRVLGAGRDVTTIDGGGAGSVVTASGVGPDTVVDGFTITGGNAGSGGGMRNWHSLPTVTDCTFSSNSASNGGGICNDYYSSPTVTNCTFYTNSAPYGGGMYNHEYSLPTVTNCTFSNNSAKSGGGMYNGYYSSPTVTNCTFSGNSATYGGGGMCNYMYSSSTVTDCAFSNNTAYLGGGMFNWDYCLPTVTNCTFSGNSGDRGGGMYNQGWSSPTVTNCTFSNNSADYGGAIHMGGSSSPSIRDNTFHSNRGESEYTSYGGAIFIGDCEPVIDGNIFIDNSADWGGGIASWNEHSVSSSTIVNNVFQANDASSGGGGVGVRGSAKIEGNSFQGNTAGWGGAIASSVATPIISNNIICENSARWGAGLWLSLVSVTMSNNVIVSNVGHGVYNRPGYPSTTNIFNAIIWGNGDDLYNCTATYSDIEDGDPGEGNISADPMFVDPAAGDYHLQAGSPCIDKGTNEGAPTEDIEGNPRPIDGDGDDTATTDMGAYEYVPLVATLDFDPDTLNLRSKGKFVTVYIELPLGYYDVSQIDVSSIMLNDAVPALDKPTQVGDYDSDGVPDLMVKFDRAAVESILNAGEQVEITITGEVAGIGFKGSDVIRVIGG